MTQDLDHHLNRVGIIRIHDGRPHGGASLFLCSGRLYITDLSGNHPLDTDDPPMYLNTRIIYVSESGMRVKTHTGQSVVLGLPVAHSLQAQGFTLVLDIETETRS